MPIAYAYFHVLPIHSASKCIAVSDNFFEYILAENNVVLTQDSGFQLQSLSLPPQIGSVTPNGVTTHHLGTTALQGQPAARPAVTLSVTSGGRFHKLSVVPPHCAQLTVITPEG